MAADSAPARGWRGGGGALRGWEEVRIQPTPVSRKGRKLWNSCRSPSGAASGREGGGGALKPFLPPASLLSSGSAPRSCQGPPCHPLPTAQGPGSAACPQDHRTPGTIGPTPNSRHQWVNVPPTPEPKTLVFLKPKGGPFCGATSLHGIPGGRAGLHCRGGPAPSHLLTPNL